VIFKGFELLLMLFIFQKIDDFLIFGVFWLGRRPFCGGIRGGGSPPGEDEKCCLIYYVNRISSKLETKLTVTISFVTTKLCFVV